MDVATAQSTLVELMASLYAKRATGRGYTTQTSLLGMAAFTQGERLIGPDGELTDTYHLTRSEENTSELQSLMRISYAVFCLKTKTKPTELQQLMTNPYTHTNVTTQCD